MSVVERRIQAATDRSCGLVAFRRLSGILEKSLYVAAAKAFDSPDRMTGEFAPSHHPVYRHRRELQQIRELTDRIKLGLYVFIGSWSLHYLPFPLFGALRYEAPNYSARKEISQAFCCLVDDILLMSQFFLILVSSVSPLTS
jgi:hypothetical protein